VISVVVLAAGQGRRFGGGYPKALLSVPRAGGGSETLLERHHRLWQAGGASQVLAMVGPSLADRFPAGVAGGLQIAVTRDQDQACGSAHTLAQALSLLRAQACGADVVILDADTVYDSSLVSRVLREPGSNLFVAPASAGDDEEVRVYVRADGRPALLGKALAEPVVQDLSLIGESVGVIRLAQRDLPRAEALLRWILGVTANWRAYGSAGRASEHEDLWQYLFTLGVLGVAVLDAEVIYAECDDPDDYRRMLGEVVPALHARERGPAG